VKVARLPLACAFLLCVCMAQAADQTLEPFAATYAIRHGAMTVGESTLQLHAGDGNSYVLELRTNPKGVAKLMIGSIVETSEFELDGKDLRPLRFSAEESRGKGSQSITFDWAKGIAHSQRDGEQADVKLEPRVLDHSLIQIALMRDLALDRKLAPYLIVEKNGLRRYQYERVGEGNVETPAGTFRVIEVLQTRSGSSREMHYWCAPDLAYLPVRIEQHKEGKVLLSMVLKSSQGLEGKQEVTSD
jgi:hypothetical protein